MPESKFYLKYHIYGLDRDNNPIDKKFKSMKLLMDEVGDDCNIYNRQTIYKIINGYYKESHQDITIKKIREPIPYKIITKKILIDQ